MVQGRQDEGSWSFPDPSIKYICSYVNHAIALHLNDTIIRLFKNPTATKKNDLGRDHGCHQNYVLYNTLTLLIAQYLFQIFDHAVSLFFYLLSTLLKFR